MRWPPAVSVFQRCHWPVKNTALRSIAHFVLSTFCALLSLISWQEVRSRHVPIREQRYSSQAEAVSTYCCGSSASIPLLLSFDLMSTFQLVHNSREAMMRRLIFSHLTSQNHQILSASKKSQAISRFEPAKIKSPTHLGFKNLLTIWSINFFKKGVTHGRLLICHPTIFTALLLSQSQAWITAHPHWIHLHTMQMWSYIVVVNSFYS